MSSSEGMSSAGKSVDSSAQLDSYKKKYELLMNSCEDIEQDNHRIAYRIFKIDRMYKEANHDKKILKKRLDLHKDDWRAAYSMRNAEFESVSTPLSTTTLPTAPPPQQQKSLKLKINLTKQQATTSKASSPRLSASTPKVGTKLPPAMKILTGKPKAVMPIKAVNRPTLSHTVTKIAQGGKPQYLNRPPVASNSQMQPAKAQNNRATAEKGGKKVTKAESSKNKKRKVEKDPNAPKKPANPFLQFCKEQRQRTTELMRGASDINKQELNKVLCNRWKTLDQEEKKIYYDKYELEKQQYSLEVEMYDRQKGGMMGSLPAELFDLP